jgi:tRNA-uridine 2-sulfurtransferase
VQRMLLPIGAMEKPRVRELARELDLPVSDKPDSQEICFVPDDYASFLARRAPTRFAAGAIEDESGRELGRHDGHQHFTVGQRKGIRVPATIPLYVLRKDPTRNAVIVGPRESLDVGGVVAREVVWYPSARMDVEVECTAQVRAHGAPIPARAQLDGEGSEATLRIQFGRPEAGVAAGQAVVLYDRDERILGGGWISDTFRA